MIEAPATGLTTKIIFSYQTSKNILSNFFPLCSHASLIIFCLCCVEVIITTAIQVKSINEPLKNRKKKKVNNKKEQIRCKNIKSINCTVHRYVSLVAYGEVITMWVNNLYICVLLSFSYINLCVLKFKCKF